MSPFHFLLILSLVANQLLACGHSHQHMTDHQTEHNHEHYQTPHLHLSFSKVSSESSEKAHHHHSAEHSHPHSPTDDSGETDGANLKAHDATETESQALILLPVVQVATNHHSDPSFIDISFGSDLANHGLTGYWSVRRMFAYGDLHSGRSWFHPGAMGAAPPQRELPLAFTRLQV